MMNKWHEITFYRSERLGSLTVNAEPPAVGYSPGPYNILSLEQNLHIGGITDDLKSEINFNAGVKKGFAGYIQNVSCRISAPCLCELCT